MKLNTWGSVLVVAAIASIASVGGTVFYLTTNTRHRLVVATTTSLFDTGLLDEVETRFEAEHNIDLYFVSVGTGIAIQFAQRGDADMILVHSPSSERSFLEEGYGVNRKILAYNFFELVGPKDDPVEISGLLPVEALEKIVFAARNSEARWISRGDGSGTHSKEKALWKAVGFNWTELRDETSWFVETGSGMGNTLKTTNELCASGLAAYTIADVGTFLAYSHPDQNQIPHLRQLVTEGPELLNVYSAIAVNKTLHPKANFDGATVFTRFLVSEEAQQLIGSYGMDKHGQNLFFPAATLLTQNPNSDMAQVIRDYAFFEGSECPAQYRHDQAGLYG